MELPFFSLTAKVTVDYLRCRNCIIKPFFSYQFEYINSVLFYELEFAVNKVALLIKLARNMICTYEKMS